MSKKIRYFDYNATHPPFTDILVKIQNDYFSDFYNPSGPTRFSLARQGKIEEARKTLESYTGKPAKEFVFPLREPKPIIYLQNQSEENFLVLRSFLL